jgi:hypothetical protein
VEERRLKYVVYALLTPVVLVGLIAGAIALGCFCVALWTIEAADAVG